MSSPVLKPDRPGLDPQSVPQVATPDGRARLLFVALSLDVGGAERHLSSLLPELVRRGWPVSLFCTNRLGAYAEDVRRAGVDIIAPPIERKSGSQGKLRRLHATARAGATLYRVMRQLRPHVVHFFLPEPYLIGAPTALYLRVPVRVMSRRGLNLYQRNWPGSAAIERRLHPHMTAVLANSRRVAADLEAEGCSRDQIGLIYNGVALGGIEAPKDRGAVRRSLGIDEAAVVAIVVANLIHYKGHTDLLHALAASSDRLPPGFKVLCIGRDDGALASLEATRRALGLNQVVEFLGVRSDVPDLLAASDLSVLPSHEEGFSNAVIEAMAGGLPLVVTDVGGNPEAVIDGETGFVVPPHDPSALGAAIAHLVGDATLRTRLGDAGRARALRHFSLEACVDRYETLYRGLLAGKKLSDLGLS